MQNGGASGKKNRAMRRDHGESGIANGAFCRQIVLLSQIKCNIVPSAFGEACTAMIAGNITFGFQRQKITPNRGRRGPDRLGNLLNRAKSRMKQMLADS
ncbi:MAG: hypothetical protein U1D35_00200 [Paracoccaceae bacterium]|nr:hypothetical protein [Paracoccaceae bacterium]